MAQSKYVAAGFTTDAGLLLSDFIKANSLDFSVFVEIWKAKNFSLVYMGRSSEFELTEFTQEIFSLSARYLTTETSLNARVGAVYLMYALFRNQILNPPLRIRMVKEQFEVLANIRKALDGNRSLCYVIDYLCEYGTDWVACPTLMGPMVHGSRGKPVRSSANELSPAAMASLKSNLVDLADSKVLQKASDLSAEYARVKASVIAVDSGISGNSCRRLADFAVRLQDLLIDAPEVGCYRRWKKSKRIGARRTRLKQKAMGQQLSEEDSDRDESYVPRGFESKKRGKGSEKVKKPVEDQGKSLKAEVLGKFNKRKKPKNFRNHGNYWAPNDSETLSKDAAEISYWYKKDTVSDACDSESEDVDSPKPIESADEVEH